MVIERVFRYSVVYLERMKDNIISKHIGFDWADDVELLCKKLILQHKWSNKNYNRGEYVFDIAPSNLGFFQPLFDIIKQEVITLYPKADIPDRIFNKSWAYVSNQDRTVSFMHNHMSEKIRKDISTVFYLKKPPHSGDIMFLLGDEEYIHTPVEGELLIFPATYYHSPLPSQTKEYRIAINVNVVTLNEYEYFLDNDWNEQYNNVVSSKINVQ